MEINELMNMPVNELMAALIHSEVDAEPAEDELQHWGVQGMKWGVRRYQNKDGSLTKAGKKRYGTRTNFDRVQAAKKAAEKYNSKEAKAKRKADARAEAEIAKYRKKMGEKDKKDDESDESKPKTTSGNDSADAKPKRKPISEMNDDELRQVVNRLQLEKQFNEYYSALHPKKVSIGEKFMNKMKDAAVDVTVDVAKNTTKSFMDKKLKEILGNEAKPDKWEQMKKEVEHLDLEKRYNDYKKTKSAEQLADEALAAEAKRLQNRRLVKIIKKELGED